MTVSRWQNRLGIILLCLLFSLALAAPAAHAQGSVRFVIGARYWYAGNQKETMDIAPLILHDRTYLPVRYLAQALGIDPGQISWQQSNQTVTLTAGETTVKLALNSKTAYVNGTPLTLDAAPLLVPPGRVMLPARPVAQALGWQVDWQSARQTVVVYPREVAVAHDAVNVRKSPAITAPVLTALARGTLLAVTGQADTWLQVGLPKGGTGWIAGYLVNKTGVPVPPAPPSPSRGQSGTPPQTTAPAQTTSPALTGDSPLIRVPLNQGLTQASFSLNNTGQLLDSDTGRVLATLAPGQEQLVLTTPTGLSVAGTACPPGTHDLLIQASSTTSAVPFLVSMQTGTTTHRYRGALVLQLTAGLINVYDQLPLEQYLYGVVPKEMSPSDRPAALEAQAVAARGYVLAHLAGAAGRAYTLLNSGGAAYGGYDAENPASDQAVDLTRGMVLMYGGQPADAVYFADDGGYTENSEDVWSKAVPYLRGKPDPYDPTGRPGGQWQATYTNAELSQQLTAAGYPLASIESIRITAFTAAGHRIKELAVTGRGTDGRPQSTTIRNADNVRLALNLRAAPFTMTQTTTGTAPATVTFTGAGDGHCVGLSQEGAEAMAQSGHSYQDILGFYYTGVSLVSNYGR